jgi:hypothetical protein
LGDQGFIGVKVTIVLDPYTPSLKVSVPDTALPPLVILKFVLLIVDGSKVWLNCAITGTFNPTPLCPLAGLTETTEGCGAVYPVDPLKVTEADPKSPTTSPVSSTSTT